jgi:hypothetical protein
MNCWLQAESVSTAACSSIICSCSDSSRHTEQDLGLARVLWSMKSAHCQHHASKDKDYVLWVSLVDIHKWPHFVWSHLVTTMLMDALVTGMIHLRFLSRYRLIWSFAKKIGWCWPNTSAECRCGQTKAPHNTMTEFQTSWSKKSRTLGCSMVMKTCTKSRECLILHHWSEASTIAEA